MKLVIKKIGLASIILIFFMVAFTSCTTQNPPVNAYTGATKVVKK